ncbi:MAG: hypothetical protein R2932_26760 [Caldilineaceae bacterium]
MAPLALQQPRLLRRQLWTDYLVSMFFLSATGYLVYAEANFMIASWWRWLAIMMLSWWLPGILLIRRWQPPALDWPTAALLALGLGWCWQIALMILMHWLPGPLSYSMFLTFYAGGGLLLLFLAWGQPWVLQPTSMHTTSWFLLLLVVAMLLRLPGLGYHEFHQDETHLLRRANEALRGEDVALAQHTKGIGEIAAVMVSYRALHTATEGTARMPFALASVGGVLALALLGQRLFAKRYVGLAAGLLFAVNGFALGLARIAQYQPVVLLLSILAFLAMWEFYRAPNRIWLALAVILSAFGVVMHYEYLLNLLPLLALFFAGLQRAKMYPSPTCGALLRTLCWSSLAAAAIVAVTYVPLLLNPYFATTRAYLDSRVVDGRTNNLAFFVEMATLYNSIYYVVGLVGLVAGGLYMGWHRGNDERALWEQRRWVTLLLLIWFLPAALLYLFIVQYPGTHFYFFMSSWSLLAAPCLVTLVSARTKPSRQFGRWVVRGGVILWFAISIGYLSILFFRQSPAYLVNYPQTRLALYWAPYGDQIPLQPRFGFPIYQGWKAIGVLGEWGYLSETYTSNERSDLLRWYLRSLDREALADDPELVFVAHHVQEVDPDFNDDRLEETYQRIGEVRVRGSADCHLGQTTTGSRLSNL